MLSLPFPDLDKTRQVEKSDALMQATDWIGPVMSRRVVSLHVQNSASAKLFMIQCISLGLQDVDPCDDLSDEDIRTAIQNATGPRSVLFVPEVSPPPCWKVLRCQLYLSPRTSPEA